MTRARPFSGAGRVVLIEDVSRSDRERLADWRAEADGLHWWGLILAMGFGLLLVGLVAAIMWWAA